MVGYRGAISGGSAKIGSSPEKSLSGTSVFLWGTYWTNLTPFPLIAYGISESEIQLSVTDVFSGGAKIAWYGSDDGVTYVKMLITSKGILTYTESGLSAGTYRYYKCRAELGSNYSLWSNVAETASWVSEYTTLYNAVAGTKPSAQVADAQNYFIWYQQGNNSDSRDTWSKYACIIPYVAGMPTAGDDLIWWNNPARKATVSATAPIYTAKQGRTGNGSSAYIDTTFNPSTDGGALYTQNDNSNIHYFYNNRVTGADTGSGLIISDPGLGVYPRAVDGNCYYRAQNTYQNITNTQGANFVFTATRSSATALKLYRNKTKVSDVSKASTALQNATAWCLAFNNGSGSAIAGTYQTDTIGLVAYASSFDATDVAVLNDALDAMMMKIQATTVLMSDTCDGSTIDLTKWDITNGDVTSVTFEQNDELIVNSLSTLDDAWHNFIASVYSQQWGVWRFSAYQMIPMNTLGLCSFGIKDDINSNRVEFYQKNGTVYLTFRIIINNASVYEVENVTPDFGQIKIIITPLGNISAYIWTNDSWLQIGATQNFKVTANYLNGNMKVFMMSRGSALMKMAMRDVYISKGDYITIIPT